PPSSFISVVGLPSLSNLKRKNSGSGPRLNEVYPMSSISLMIFFKFDLGSPSKGSPPISYTSQINLADFALSSDQGKILQVLKSGLRYISDSSTRTNPSIEDPSNIISPSSALPSWVVGISTFLIVPRISVNCSLTYLTFSDSAILKISSLEYSSISLTRPYIIENIVHLKLSSAQILIYPLACFRSYKHYTEK